MSGECLDEDTTGPRRRLGSHRRDVTLLAGVPLAYSGLDALPYKGTTTTAEYRATGFATTHATAWASDDHLVRIEGAHTRTPTGTRSPAIAWIADDTDPPGCFTLVQASWTRTGAQAYPLSPRVIEPQRLHDHVVNSDRVYHGGGPDAIIGVTPRATHPEAC